MSSYTIVVGVGQGPILGRLTEIMNRIQRMDTLLDQLADEVVMPILGEHYAISGIKTRSGGLLDAITKRGAKGNIIQKTPGMLIVGIDYGQYPTGRWVIDGRGPVVPKTKKVLHWKDPDTGKDVFAKHVKAVPEHPIYYLTSSDLSRIEHALTLKIMMSEFI